ncbi:DUF1353 domain-containing protein [Bradyrhizobium sp. HKCCYLRH1030]|uniref:DUF1353 domain-containing protein n=1 Tax=Bradyrhizobium sp. HKCCYLRH1030 TaxID=3420744 RepID=UPI003EB8FA18
MNRRDFLGGIASSWGARWAAPPLLALSSVEALAAKRGSDPHLVEHWMDQWLASNRLPVGTLEITRFKDPMYFLIKPIGWKPNDASSAVQEVTVPAGFVTDFASIPRPFWTLLRPDGEYAYAAVIHDYLYWTQTRPRHVCDQILKLAMEDFGVGTVTATTIYEAVRLGGGLAWRQNAKLKAAGEHRILKDYPGDPRITWREWKQRPGVFRDPE